MAKLNAREKLARKKDIKHVTLTHNYGGMAEGERMFVATPQIVDNYIRGIPMGESRSIPELRDDLAKSYDCDGTCPMSTSIFIRMSAEAALETIADTDDTSSPAPFWRVLTAGDKITKRLNIDPEWVEKKRALEQG